MKDKSIKDLAVRLNEITAERDRLDMEYNQIVKELWDRIPSLKTNPNIQPKQKVKVPNE